MVSSGKLSEARTVLQFAPDLADQGVDKNLADRARNRR
jgi:hypothetical protein